MTREEAIETLEEIIKLGDLYAVDIEACEIAIEALKQEPKTGHWIDYEDSAEVQCYQCHRVWSMFSNEVNTFLYCPNCGAKMESEVEA